MAILGDAGPLQFYRRPAVVHSTADDPMRSGSVALATAAVGTDLTQSRCGVPTSARLYRLAEGSTHSQAERRTGSLLRRSGPTTGAGRVRSRPRRVSETAVRLRDTDASVRSAD